MLTGRAAFEGKTVGEVFARVFRVEPDWNCLPVGVPEGIRRVAALFAKRPKGTASTHRGRENRNP